MEETIEVPFDTQTLAIEDFYAIIILLFKKNFRPTHTINTITGKELIKFIHFKTYNSKPEMIQFLFIKDNMRLHLTFNMDKFSTCKSLMQLINTCLINLTHFINNKEIQSSLSITIKKDDIDISNDDNLREHNTELKLNNAFTKLQFCVLNFKYVYPVIDYMQKLSGIMPKKEIYTINSVYKYNSIINLFKDKNWLELIMNIDYQKYISFLNFLNYIIDKKSETQITFKNVRINFNDNLYIRCDNTYLYSGYEPLHVFKYILHPGLCLVLQLIGDEEILKHKYYKKRLLTI